MAKVRGKGSVAERRVRSLAHAMGYRFRLHGAKLPGKPDLVFAPRRKVIFVHGCFWHRHDDPGCRFARMPSSRQDYWRPKLEGNRQRDKRTEAAIADLGWTCLVIWECQLRDESMARETIRAFLGDRPSDA